QPLGNVTGTPIVNQFLALAPAIGGRTGLLVLSPGLTGPDIPYAPGFTLWDGSQYTSITGKNGAIFLTNTYLQYSATVFDDASANPHKPEIYATPTAAGSFADGWVSKFSGEEWTRVGTSWPTPGPG